VRGWENPQGATVSDFAGFPTLKRYLADVWIFPRNRHPHVPPGMPWTIFESPGGQYTPDWMVQAAVLIDNSVRIAAHDKGFAPIYLREADALLQVLKHGDKRLWERARDTLLFARKHLDTSTI
jgi:hypothetical protein